ncbi:capping protein-inhibiting regulator of actin dynamics isoform X2 [Scomber japonicus]|uniref:capping protein-inhibiting regulator of actin dynamics isoform X2 n=1 Tax=Scomber japonicus TaxID=13676 RepID=UPI00230531D1|nr:capping protein-inhibiting regulator of actin dynamics isoform X2 [Scomber japonicus]
MSWFQSLRDDFTLKPFETLQTHSDSAAMASGPPDVMEPAEVGEECSGKKKSKFQTFKKFFARKKRKEPSSSGADAELKASQSSDNVSKTSENNTLTRAEKDKGSGSKISLGSKALSHDSVFVSDSSEANEALGASQDSIHGKVKSLQLQLKQAIKIGSPPSLMCVKKAEDAGTMSEDDGLPCSPPEYTTHHTVQNQAQRNSSISLEVTDSDEDQLSCTASSRAVSPLVVIPGDFSQPASPFGCLDNSAAKHKMGLRHKACNKRKPVNRLGIKAEEDPVVKEILNTSFPDSPEEKEEQDKEDAGEDELKLKVEREEEDEEEEKEQPQHSKETVLRDKEEWEEGEDESEAEQDVSQGLDASFPPEQCLSEEEAADAQPSSKRASSLESPRATPEPPADHREYLLDTLDVETEEKRNDENPTLGGEEEVDEPGEEGGSFLQEVLSSLKTPLPSSSLGAETEAVLEIEEEEEEKGEADIEEGEEVKEKDAEEEEPVSYQATPSGSLLLSQTANEEEEEAATLSVSAPPCQDFEEEDKDQEKVEEDEVEELEVEQFSQHSEDEGQKEEAEEVQPRDENDLLQRKTDLQVEEEEEDQSEGEEEAIELEKEPKVEEEGWEKKEEDDVEVEVKTEKERVEEAEEAEEEEEEEEEEESDDAEEAVEIFPDAASGEVHSVASAQEADEGVDVAVGDETVCIAQCTNDNDDIPADQADQESATVHESQTASNQNSEDEMSDGEEGMEEGVEIEHKEPKSDQEEDMEANQADVEPDLEKESVEVSIFKQKDQTEVSQSATEEVSSKPTSLCLQESNFEAQSEDSKTSPATTTIHINLYSPSSEKGTFSFKQSPTAADPEISESPSDAGEATEQITAPTDEESADKVEEEEKEEQQGKQSSKEDATPHVSAEETEERSSGSDQSKVRFTINSAWQRSLSIEDSGTPPLTPSACVSSSSSIAAGSEGVDVASTAKKDPQADAEPESSAKPELVLSPSRARNAGITIAKPQSNASQTPAKPPAPAATTTEENPVVLEGNPDNPFGVRLRKTVALHRFSSEEENSEPPIEPPAQPTSCKVESTQPISAKPSISQPISNKPALPKKPEVHGESGVKTKRVSDPPPVRGVTGGSNSPSWITVAKQKQRIYKENSLEEITVKKEEQERKSSLPMYFSSAASREQSHKTSESTGKVSSLETSKSSVSVEKETRRALSPPTPVPPQPPKSQSLPCPVPPKPQPPPASAKPTPQPTPAQRSLSPPTPVPVPQKPLSCTSPPLLSKPAPSSKPVQAQSTTVTSPPFSSRTASPQSGSKAPALSGQTPSTQRSLPSSDSPQDEPPWMALAKKKAKAWSEMPQIVQ